MTKRKLIFLILSCIWMVVIFCFSACDADESEDDSYMVGLAVGRVFVSGRSGQIKDVLIDGVGALVGILVIIFIMKCIKRHK